MGWKEERRKRERKAGRKIYKEGRKERRDGDGRRTRKERKMGDERGRIDGE